MVETPSFIDLTSQIRRTETTTPTANQSKNKKKEKKEDSVNDEFVNLLTSPEIGRSTPSTVFRYPPLNENHLCSELSIELQLGILEVIQIRSLEFQVQFCDSNMGTLQLMN